VAEGHAWIRADPRKKWELENRPLATELPAVRATRYPMREPDFLYRAFLADVLRPIAGSVLVDVRSPAEFNGEVIAPPGMTERARSGLAMCPVRRASRGPRQPTKMERPRMSTNCASSTPAKA
jgi:hypothetical protein